MSEKERWVDTQRCAENWKAIGASDYVVRFLKFGIWDPPTTPFCHGKILPEVVQNARDREFGEEALKEGCLQGTYEQVTKAYAEDHVRPGCHVSSAFVDWSKEKGRFIINLKLQSTHWEKRSVKMETVSNFGSLLRTGDHLLSFDWHGGYRHFRLHKRMWKWFIFRYSGRYYQCIALPFGWTRSPYWFCHLLAPLTRYIRYQLNGRVLRWLDDYLLAPGNGSQQSNSEDCQRLSRTLDDLFPTLGLRRHPEKGVWGTGTTRIEHLGLTIDTVKFRFFVTPQKLKTLNEKANHLLQTAAKLKRRVRESQLRTFTGTAISQLVPLPLARFFTRALHDDLRMTQPRRGRFPEQSVRLSNAGIRDLKAWHTMSTGDGRLIYGGEESWNLHTDAADIGYGGTLGPDMSPGAMGEVEVRSIWSPLIRLKSITHRELVAVRLALEQDLVQARLRGYHGRLLLHVDNIAVFHILNNMVSANPALVEELRNLHAVLTEMKITFRASWLPSAMNKHADRLSRTWNPKDLAATTSLVDSLTTSLQLQKVRRYWPLKDAPSARTKVLRAQMADFWGDGLGRLWNPPPDLIQLTLLKIHREGAFGLIIVPHWTGVPWYSLLRRVSAQFRVLHPGRGQLFASDYVNPAWALELAIVGPKPKVPPSLLSQFDSLPLQGDAPDSV